MSIELPPISHTWAIKQALQGKGIEGPSVTELFGLCNTAQYQIRKVNGILKFRFFNPHMIRDGLSALNIGVVRFNYLCQYGLDQITGRAQQGASTIIEIDRNKFCRMSGGLLPIGLTYEHSMHECAAVVQKEDSLYKGEHVTLLTPENASGITLPISTFDTIWKVEVGNKLASSFYWCPVVKLNFDKKSAYLLSLKKYIQAMQTSFPTLGHFGFGALTQLKHILKSGDATVLHHALSEAKFDGGNHLGRLQMATYLSELAHYFDSIAFDLSASTMRTVALTWQEIDNEFQKNYVDLDFVTNKVDDIIEYEQSVLANIDLGLRKLRVSVER